MRAVPLLPAVSRYNPRAVCASLRCRLITSKAGRVRLHQPSVERLYEDATRLEVSAVLSAD